MIECTQCGEQVPPETTTYRERDGRFAWKCCCSCLAELRVIDKNDPLNDPFGVFATVDAAWRDLLETGEIACLAVPINSQRIPMDAVITFRPRGELLLDRSQSRFRTVPTDRQDEGVGR